LLFLSEEARSCGRPTRKPVDASGLAAQVLAPVTSCSDAKRWRLAAFHAPNGWTGASTIELHPRVRDEGHSEFDENNALHENKRVAFSRSV